MVKFTIPAVETVRGTAVFSKSSTMFAGIMFNGIMVYPQSYPAVVKPAIGAVLDSPYTTVNGKSEKSSVPVLSRSLS